MSQAPTKKRTKKQAQQQTEYYKVFISFLFNRSHQTKERKQTIAEEHTYIISNERQKRSERASEANNEARTAAICRDRESKRAENNFYLLFDHCRA